MSVDDTLRALLDLVEAERARQCESALDAGRAQAAATLARAHADARATVRRTFAEARERREARLAAADAELATRERIARQHHLATLLAEGWQQLPDALMRRWRDPTLRRMWTEHVVARAREVLPRARWRIVHPPDWPAEERMSLAATLDIAPTFVADAAHRAGIAIASSSNVIDGTLESLVADRDEVGGRLLRELERAREPVEVPA